MSSNDLPATDNEQPNKEGLFHCWIRFQLFVSYQNMKVDKFYEFLSLPNSFIWCTSITSHAISCTLLQSQAGDLSIIQSSPCSIIAKIPAQTLVHGGVYISVGVLYIGSNIGGIYCIHYCSFQARDYIVKQLNRSVEVWGLKFIKVKIQRLLVHDWLDNSFD